MNEAVKGDYQFIRGSLALFPYNPKVGVYKEEALIVLYNRLKADGLWQVVFHENLDMSMLEFMNFFSNSNCLLQILAIVKDQMIVDIAGMAWTADLAICQGILTRAVGSFLFFKNYQKPSYTDQFAEMILEYWFEQLGIDTMVGVTPEPNRAALIYVKRAGFKEVGRLPNYTTYNGEIVTGVVTMMTKQEYRQLVGE